MKNLAPAVYTIAEACAVAGIRRTTLYKEIRSGGLRGCEDRRTHGHSRKRTASLARSQAAQSSLNRPRVVRNCSK